MKTEYQYIHFEEEFSRLEARKTRVFYCVSSRGDGLGVVKWYSSWRQYCFEPQGNTVFNNGCLADIQHFIKQLMDARSFGSAEGEGAE